MALLTTADAAVELAISARTLSRWAKEGYVRPAFVTRSGGYRWDLDDLKAQLRAKQDEDGTLPAP
ncbi:helix-turn-helix domain-containing protein [Actinomycetospora sp. CA-101289]|uniref:helix-turn-helix domain-containing protein n=1 Tax=Actinomycetospora sp. CA-101289 TaxID=3239893 RepID=UPI003D997FCF